MGKFWRKTGKTGLGNIGETAEALFRIKIKHLRIGAGDTGGDGHGHRGSKGRVQSEWTESQGTQREARPGNLAIQIASLTKKRRAGCGVDGMSGMNS